MRVCLQPMDFMQTSTIASLHSIKDTEIRGVSRRSDCPCSRGVLSFATLCCQDTVRIILFRFSMLDETVETRRPWRGFSLPRRPCRGISAFHGHNSTVSRQLRYALTRERLCCRAVAPAAYAPRSDA